MDTPEPTPEPYVDSRLNPTLEQTSFRLGSPATIAAQLPTLQNVHGDTFRTQFRPAAFSTVQSRDLIRGQNITPNR
jgi:hypothetical protein